METVNNSFIYIMIKLKKILEIMRKRQTKSRLREMIGCCCIQKNIHKFDQILLTYTWMKIVLYSSYLHIIFMSDNTVFIKISFLFNFSSFSW